MDLLLYTQSGNVISHEMAMAVDHLLEMEKKMPKWEFIGKIVSIWARKNPDLWKSYTSASENEKYRGELKNEFGATADKGMRKILDIPGDLYDLLRFFYPEEIDSKKFQLSFAKEFPMFRFGDKL